MWVLLLDFAVAGATLQVPGVIGAIIEADVACYPGAAPQRGMFVGERQVVATASGVPAAGAIGAALDQGATWLGANPWLDRYPAALAPVTALLDGEEGWVVDGNGDGLRLGHDTDAWPLLALTGGRPVELFGEVEGERFHPAAVGINGALVGL